MLLTQTNTTDFNPYEVDKVEARFVKLIGYGRFNSEGDTRVSVWSAVGEIEFYGDEIVSADEIQFANRTSIFPVPTHDILHLKNVNQADLLSVYS